MRLSPFIAAVAALSLVLCHAGTSRAQTITDIVLFRQDANGNTISQGWNTRGGDFVGNLYLKSGSTLVGGAFINSANDASTRISLDVSTPGTFTYSFVGNDVVTSNATLGINFFANNNTAAPAITARGANGGVFTASNATTSGVAFEALTGANTLTFNSNGRQITLSAFSYNTPTSTDLVQSFQTTPGDTTDTTGSFTLTVSSAAVVPEANTGMLALLAGVPAFGISLLRKRKAS